MTNNIVLAQISKNFSLFSFEALNIICEGYKIDMDLLRDHNGLDLVTNNILNGNNNFHNLLEKSNYKFHTLLNLKEQIDLSQFRLFSSFKNDRKEKISLLFNAPLTSQLTCLHLLVFLIFKNQQECQNIDFKLTNLQNSLSSSLTEIISDKEQLAYKDSEDYSVSDYICMFPTLETLNILISKDQDLSTLSKVSISNVASLIRCYKKTLNENIDCMPKYLSFMEHIEILMLQNDLQKICSINMDQIKNIVKF